MEWKEKYTYGLWGAAAGAVALAIVGFSWGDWHTSKGAAQRADAAAVRALIPQCTKDVMADATAAAELKVKRRSDWDDVVRDFYKRSKDEKGFQFNRDCGKAIEVLMPPTTATKS